MTYIFSDLEKTAILQAANVCDGMEFNVERQEYRAVAVEGRSCAVLYRVLSNILGEKFLDCSAFDENVMGIFKNAKLWLDVAIDANGGVGAYSTLIRAYTLRQGELRLNKKFSDFKMQESSNQVAVNFMNALIKGSVEHDLAPWAVPSISQIAAIDASAIGKVLFREDVGDIDTATSRNAGWSGTIGFSLLGGERPYETWRLISAGDPDSHIKGNHDLAKFNRLDDLKNILFAVDSHSAALQAVIKNFGSNMVESLFSVLPEQINIALASGNINPLIQHVVKGTPISPIVSLILRYNLNDFFDMLRRTYDGNSAATPTTDETFASNAYTFFSALSPSQSQSIVTRTIGEYGSAKDWATLASQATPIGAALRNSLKQLSEIVIERADGFSGRELELYDPETGEGFITEQWLADRSEMLARLIARTNGSFGRNTVQTFSYSDLASGKQGADYLISGPGEDWLYGENGPDTYIVEAHDGATTIIADVLNPVFLRPEVGVSGWHEEFAGLDVDTVVLPEEAKPDKLKLTWGAVLVETVNIELSPAPLRGAHRQPPRAKMLYTTLDIEWGGTQKVRIVLPNPNDLSGSGIERVRFADGSSINFKDVVSRLGIAPDTYHHGITVQYATQVKSFRDNRFLPLVGGRGNDTLSGAGEIRGMQGDDLLGGGSGDDVLYGGPGNDTLSGGGGNDVYKYDGLGRDLVVNAGGGTDGIDFSEVGLSIDQLKFHRERDDLVIVVSYGMSPKIRVSEHFSGDDAAISFISVQGEEGAVKSYTANQLAELLHPLPPLRDVEDILPRNDEEALRAMKEIIAFYELNV
ncbi:MULTISPECIES: hypothetical protein [Pseudomonas]|uniref:hypothetical protein n=1 Tax=Pseudomonas TaxID=286 RepID=UPI00087602DE|nr:MULTISPECIES: hypothetical protein [Pseudomonas]SCZ23212.1 Hemolysin-type calcium-binding repeat-containing protein [Pseudomonas sp. NFIX46]SDB57439.1 Hemolysin-type calcium-binding repeat-containing protein [Pseudomonas putida]SFQ73614.1 Hemolysin-type calcium-binding repeat-containing protein [Pseudomonas sp. NFIX49]